MRQSRAAELRLWRMYSGDPGGEDAQALGLKKWMVASTTSWHVCSALAMTAGFALLVFNPHPSAERVQDLTAIEWAVARWVYLALVLLSIVSSTLGVLVGAFFLHDVQGVPAAPSDGRQAGRSAVAPRCMALGVCCREAGHGPVSCHFPLLPARPCWRASPSLGC